MSNRAFMWARGGVFVEVWENKEWQLSCLPLHKFLLGKLLGVIGAPGSDADCRRVPYSQITFDN